SWVMVDIEWQIGTRILEAVTGKDKDSTTDSTAIYVNYVCRNAGKSFAQITEKGYVFKIVSIVPEKPLPQEPDFSGIDIFHHASEYVAPDAAAEPYQLPGITCNGHRKFNNMMVIYGYAKYMD